MNETSRLSNDFTEKNNCSVAIALLLHEYLGSKEMANSGWFSKRFREKTLLQKYELKKIVEHIENVNTPQYLNDVDNLKNLLQTFLELLYATHRNGKQAEYIQAFFRLGMELSGERKETKRKSLSDRMRTMGLSQ